MMREEDIEGTLESDPSLGKYGIDWAQNEVPPYPHFGLVYTLTRGQIELEDNVRYKGFFNSLAYANIIAEQANKQTVETSPHG